MQTAPAGDLREHLVSYTRRRRCRQPVDRVLDGCGASAVRFHVQEALVGVTRTDASRQTVRPLDPAPRPVRCLGHPERRDGHDVCQPPGLLGVTAVARDLAASAVGVPSRVVGEIQVTTAQDHRRPGVRVPGRFDDADHVQRWCERVVPPADLVDAGLEMSCSRGRLARRRRSRGVIARAAILAMWTAPGRGPGVGAVPRGRVPPRGHARQVARPRPLQGVVGAAVTVQQPGGPGAQPGAQLQQGVEQAWEPPARRRAGPVRLGGVRAALRTAWTRRGRGGRRRRDARLGLAGRVRRGAAHDRRRAADTRGVAGCGPKTT